MLNWDISTLNPNKMHVVGELVQKKAKQYRLREEKNKENQVLEDAKSILGDALHTEVDTTKPILVQLAKFIQKFNEDLNGKEKLLQKEKNKFENKLLELVALKIAIYQVDFSTILGASAHQLSLHLS